MKDLPIHQELIDYLDQAFPDRCPKIDMPDRAVWMAAGARSVVDFLKTRLLVQTKRAAQNQAGLIPAQPQD